MAREESKSGFLSYKARSLLGFYGILLIPIGLLSLFLYVPVIWAMVGSFYEFEIGAAAKPVGFKNYAEFLFQDPVTWPSFGNMVFIVIFMVAVRLTIPLVVAKLIISLPKEGPRYFYRIVFLLPIVVPGVALQLIWGSMIYPDAGLLNGFLESIGLEEWTRGWLSDPATALVAVVFVGFPWVGGIDVLIYYAGLSAIPESVNEAAKLEGCTGFGKFFRIDVPMVMSQVRLILVLTIILGVQAYENILILTRGGPGFETMVPGFWMYLNAFSFQRMGYACAIGVVLFICILGLTVLTFRFVRSTEELEGRA
jgi:ABC-type sugar transport system permease subunit